jgi:nitroimidazol reductase NimA-like FMN-containing flavoprotein (pyridoxamine 5'-phosphate oxidase superfamily)
MIKDDKARVQFILQSNLHMVLSTADKVGKPWVTPVAYTFDEHKFLYWVSSKNARHSFNIRARQEAAIVIYMLQPVSDAVYIEAEAHELNDDKEIKQVMDTINSRTQPDLFRVTSLANVSGKAEWRVYKAVPKAMYVRELTTAGNQAVTVRRRVAL